MTTTTTTMMSMSAFPTRAARSARRVRWVTLARSHSSSRPAGQSLAHYFFGFCPPCTYPSGQNCTLSLSSLPRILPALTGASSHSRRQAPAGKDCSPAVWRPRERRLGRTRRWWKWRRLRPAVHDGDGPAAAAHGGGRCAARALPTSLPAIRAGVGACFACATTGGRRSSVSACLPACLPECVRA